MRVASDSLEFCLLVERGPLEAQAVLLCESIRRFAGRYSRSRISVLSPRASCRPAEETRRRIIELGADYIEMDLESPVPSYGPSFRVFASAERARQDGPPIMAVIDTDTIFVAEPSFEINGAPALARPEDTVGMCSTGPGDWREAHWEAMCRVNGVSIEDLPWVTAPVEKKRMRASYNGGLVIAPRSFFVEIETCFQSIAKAELRSHPGRLNGIRIGAGYVFAEGYSMWGTSQAAITIAAARLGGAVGELDDAYNIPLHLLQGEEVLPQSPVHIHYHWLLNDLAEGQNAMDRILTGMPEQRAWVAERLPLPWRATEGTGVFSPDIQVEEYRESGAVPACSVVMAVHNDMRFLRAAVDSVIAQDCGDWELIIVDDGSDAPDYVARLVELDRRIRTIRSPSNVGHAAALNLGIAQSRSPIVIRLDADDLAEPQRIGRLLAEFDADPELGLVGSAVTLIDEAGQTLGTRTMPETDLAVRWTMLFHCPFYHSATAFRRTVFEGAGGYRSDMRVSEDHYLWFDMLPNTRARNLPDPLCRYRINRSGLTARHIAGKPPSGTDPIRQQLWREIGICYPLDDELGRDASELLRQGGVYEQKRRARAIEVITAALDRVLALRHEFERASEVPAVDGWQADVRGRLSRIAPRLPVRRRVVAAWRERGAAGFAAALFHRVTDKLGLAQR